MPEVFFQENTIVTTYVDDMNVFAKDNDIIDTIEEGIPKAFSFNGIGNHKTLSDTDWIRNNNGPILFSTVQAIHSIFLQSLKYATTRKYWKSFPY